MNDDNEGLLKGTSFVSRNAPRNIISDKGRGITAAEKDSPLHNHTSSRLINAN